MEKTISSIVQQVRVDCEATQNHQLHKGHHELTCHTILFACSGKFPCFLGLFDMPLRGGTGVLVHIEMGMEHRLVVHHT